MDSTWPYPRPKCTYLKFFSNFGPRQENSGLELVDRPEFVSEVEELVCHERVQRRAEDVLFSNIRVLLLQLLSQFAEVQSR